MYPTQRNRLVSFLALVALIATVAPRAVIAQDRFSLEDVLAPGYPFELVSAKKVDRVAWLVFEQGRRNVYTAAAPDFVPDRLTSFLEDDGVDLTDLRISDDGKVLVFVRGHAPNSDGWVANPMSDPRGGERAIWAVRTDGGDPWKVVVASGPVLAGDGSMVLFTRGGQIHGVAVDPMQPANESTGTKPLFLVYGTNSGPTWSPDSKRIAFTSTRSGHSFIGLYEAGAARVSYLAPGVDRDTSPTWSPDGSQIAFIRQPGPAFGAHAEGGDRAPGERKGLRRAAFAGGYTFSLWVGDLASGEAREFWHTSPEERTWTEIRRIRWAGDHMLFEMEPGNWRNHYAIAADGSTAEPIELTPGEGLAENSGLSSNGRHLFYSTNAGDIDRRHIWRTPTRGGVSIQITLGDEIETYPAVLASGKQVAVLSASATRPLSVAIVSADGGTPRVIFPTFAASFPSDDQVVPKNVMLTAEDGLSFHNQVFVPRNIRPGERRPAMLFTHGGPRRQMLLGYHYRHFYHMSYAVNQYLANKGYIVISVNYRRGIGYGKEFRNAPNGRQRGNSEYQDVLAAGRYLQGRADVDPKRIGLWGLSYGGLLTAQGLARNSEIFSAGVDLAGVHLLGDSIDPEAISYKASSISAIEGWKSPVLLIHGDDDRNVPFWQTASLVQLLRAHGVYHEVIVYPDDVHDSLLHHRWLKSFNAMDDFFDRFLSGVDSGQTVLSNIDRGALAYTEGDGAVVISSTATITDTDDTDMESATVGISRNYVSDEDVLSFTPSAGIIGVFSAGTGILTLSGTATLAEYETVLKSVTYENTNLVAPNQDTRTATFRVNGEDLRRKAQTSEIEVLDIVATQTFPHCESFETDGLGTRYAANSFSFLPDDIFDRAAADRANLTGVNADGAFAFVGADTDADGNSVHSIEIIVDTSTGTSLKLHLKLAAVPMQFGASDTILIEAAADGGSYVRLTSFNPSAGVDSSLSEDTDNNGVGDGGTTLGADYTDLTFPLPDANVTRIRVSMNTSASNEQTAVDRICVTGTLLNRPSDGAR